MYQSSFISSWIHCSTLLSPKWEPHGPTGELFLSTESCVNRELFVFSLHHHHLTQIIHRYNIVTGSSGCRSASQKPLWPAAPLLGFYWHLLGSFCDSAWQTELSLSCWCGSYICQGRARHGAVRGVWTSEHGVWPLRTARRPSCSRTGSSKR